MGAKRQRMNAPTNDESTELPKKRQKKAPTAPAMPPKRARQPQISLPLDFSRTPDVRAFLDLHGVPKRKIEELQRVVDTLQDDKFRLRDRVDGLERGLNAVERAFASEEHDLDAQASDNRALTVRSGSSHNNANGRNRCLPAEASELVNRAKYLRRRQRSLENVVITQNVTIEAGNHVLPKQTARLRKAEGTVADLQAQLDAKETALDEMRKKSMDAERESREELLTIKGATAEKDATIQLLQAWLYDSLSANAVMTAQFFPGEIAENAGDLKQIYASQLVWLVNMLQRDVGRRDEIIASLQSNDE